LSIAAGFAALHIKSSCRSAALLGSIPVAIIYSFFVEHYVAGLTAGSVKG
jgi:ABC-type maltose transport system permease subunit